MRIADRPIAERVAAACRCTGLSDRTIEVYSHRLAAFEDWLGVPAMEATQAQAAAWLIASSRAGAARVASRLNRCALAFLFRELRGDALDPRVVPRMRMPARRIHRVADPAEVAGVLDALPPRRPSFRVCRLIYGTGLRLGEALRARLADIDRGSRTLIVPYGKGGVSRRTIMPDSLLALIDRWCRGWPADSPIITADGRPSGRSPARDAIRADLAAARARAGVGPHLSVHRLRHAFATHLHERGVGIGELRLLLGHTSIETTLCYLGLRDERRGDIARCGDLLAALPEVPVRQLRIDLG